MDIAVTLVVQGLAFFAVAWLVMMFGWPPLMKAIETRQKRIADGLAAASKGQKDLDEAKEKTQEIIREARDRAAQLIDQAGKRSNEIVDEAKNTASSESARIVAAGHEQVALETTRAREDLSKAVASLAVKGAGQLLAREIDAKAHAELLDKLAAEIARG
jgi:F-type H+-transporting ATPase subunit b